MSDGVGCTSLSSCIITHISNAYTYLEIICIYENLSTTSNTERKRVHHCFPRFVKKKALCDLHTKMMLGIFAVTLLLLLLIKEIISMSTSDLTRSQKEKIL